MSTHWSQLKQSLQQVMAKDHHFLARKLGEIEKLARASKPVDELLEKWQAQLQRSQAQVLRR